MPEINESDWKFLRVLHKVALDRFCKKILQEIERLNTKSAKGYHQKYLEIFQVLQERNEELARAFDDMRRSRAMMKIATLRRMGLLTDDEFLGFSQETRNAVRRMLEARS